METIGFHDINEDKNMEEYDIDQIGWNNTLAIVSPKKELPDIINESNIKFHSNELTKQFELLFHSAQYSTYIIVA